MMSFDEQLRRVFDAALAELADVARADVERAREQARQQALAEGSVQREQARQQALDEANARHEQARRQALDEASARHERERQQALDEARARHEQARQQALEEGRAQGWEDGREQGRFEGQQEARDAIAAIAPPEPVVDSSALDRLLDAFRAIDRARSLSETLDAAAACAGREAARAAVILVRGSQLRGWRFVGFDASFDGASFEAALADAPVIADAVSRGETVRSDDAPSFAQPASGANMACPLDVAGQTVAVVYADGVTSDASVEAIARHASRALEALTAVKAARALLRTGNGAAEDAASGNGAAGSDVGTVADDPDAAAKRYAKLLVSEIKLYHEPAVVAGRRDRDLASRLGGEIARARVLYEQRVPQTVRGRTDYFRDELVRTLANGDATLLQLT
jgi:hypothetical protein